MTTPTKEQIRPTDLEIALIANAYCRLQFGIKKCSECIFYDGIKCTKNLNCELCHQYEAWLKNEEKAVLL